MLLIINNQKILKCQKTVNNSSDSIKIFHTLPKEAALSLSTSGLMAAASLSDQRQRPSPRRLRDLKTSQTGTMMVPHATKHQLITLKLS